MGSVVSVNTGTIESFTHEGRDGTTAIRKTPVDGAVTLRTDHVEGDEIANLDNHGGTFRTVYAYASEDLAWFGRQVDDELPPGSFGENLTTEGVDVTGAKPGERWRVGEALLEVTTIRTPCWKFDWAMRERGHEGFQRRFQKAGRPGAYLRVVEEGVVEAGDEVRVVRSREDHEVTMGGLAVAYHTDRRQRQAVLEEVDLLPGEVAEWVRGAFR